jgi:glycosyltransferase involved in cell wall biosynthesis
MRRRRICIIRQKYYVQRNVRRSAQTLLRESNRNISRSAETLARGNCEVDVICLRARGEPKHEVIGGVNVHRIGFPWRRGSVFWYVLEYIYFFLIASIKLLPIKKRYDVIEVHTMPDFLVFATIIPKLMGSKVLLFMFEDMPGLFMSSFKKGPDHIGTRVLRFIERVSAGYADRVLVSDGPLYRKTLISNGVRPDKVTVILNVPDNTVFNGPIQVSQNGDYFRLVVVSTLVERYGVQTVIKATHLLLARIPHLKVHIVGDGDYRATLEQLANQLGVRECLDFTGWIPYEAVPAQIARAHIAVAPMLHDVGTPNKLFEYFALGKPCIVSEHPGITNTVDEGCVQYFRPGDEQDLARCVWELYGSPERRALLSARGLAFYRKCEWTITKQEYLKIHDELVRA